MLKCTLKGKWFESEDEMTNLDELNFTLSNSLNLYQLNEKWMFIFHFPLFLRKAKMTVVNAVSLLQCYLVRFM